MFGDHLGPNRHSEHLTYAELTATKRLWCEPGLGIVDFDAVLAVLPSDYDGDFMIEIDEPSIESPAGVLPDVLRLGSAKPATRLTGEPLRPGTVMAGRSRVLSPRGVAARPKDRHDAVDDSLGRVVDGTAESAALRLDCRAGSKAAGHRPNVFRAYRSSAYHQLIDLEAPNCELLR